jgi:hypothetical protein
MLTAGDYAALTSIVWRPLAPASVHELCPPFSLKTNSNRMPVGV